MIVKLDELTVDDGVDVFEMLKEIGPGENGFENSGYDLEPGDFAGYLKSQVDMSRGIGIDLARYVPQTRYWLIVDGRPVGVGKLRHYLNDFLRTIGGHVGYCIRPSERGKGYGNLILEELLKKAREKGIADVLVTCGEDNIRSRRVIERSGGSLQDINDGECRYLITDMQLGLQRGTVRLLPHNPQWEGLFEEERQLLNDAFGHTIIAIEHVGSTSIPGIPAKPIIDINIGVESLEIARKMKNTFGRLGYEHRPFVPGRTPEGLRSQELYVRGPESRRTHYVHVTVYGGDYWENDLMFRDYLRHNVDRAQEYANLKMRLAQEYPNDRGSYTKNKASFVLQTLEMARETRK